MLVSHETSLCSTGRHRALKIGRICVKDQETCQKPNDRESSTYSEQQKGDAFLNAHVFFHLCKFVSFNASLSNQNFIDSHKIRWETLFFGMHKNGQIRQSKILYLLPSMLRIVHRTTADEQYEDKGPTTTPEQWLLRPWA